MRFLVTGGAGFAGSHLVEELLRQGHDVTVIDCLTYAGPLDNLAHLDSDQLKIVYHDFSQVLPDSLEPVDYVIHNGAASHVLRSLEDPGLFVQSNVIGTLNLLEWACKTNPKKFVLVSTDEVFGPASEVPYSEGDALKPTNPYSATKAGAEFLTHSYFRSFGVPAVVSRTVNMFGERQHPEKFVPLAIRTLLRGEELDIHAYNGDIGSRNWLYAGEQARALLWLAEHGVPGEAYHVAAGVRLTNLEVAEKISSILGVPLRYRLAEYAWRGHDLHYSIKESPQAINWKMPETFEELLTRTVLWYKEHPEFLTT